MYKLATNKNPKSKRKSKLRKKNAISGKASKYTSKAPTIRKSDDVIGTLVTTALLKEGATRSPTDKMSKLTPPPALTPPAPDESSNDKERAQFNSKLSFKEHSIDIPMESNYYKIKGEMESK